MKTLKMPIWRIGMLLAIILRVDSEFTCSAQGDITTNGWRGIPAVPQYLYIPGAAEIVSNILLTAPPQTPAQPVMQTSTPATVWSLVNSNWAPMPFFPLTNVPIWQLDATNNVWLMDDRGVDYSALQAQSTWTGREVLTTGDASQMPASNFANSDGLWLQVTSLDETNLNGLLHNTIEGSAYTILTKESLTNESWVEEQLAYGRPGDSTPIQVVRNSRGTVFVWARTGAPSTGLAILEQPIDQEAYEGDTITFAVAARGSGPLCYQWAFNGSNIAGATSTAYTLDPTAWGMGGYYSVAVSDSTSTVQSRDASLLIHSGHWDPNYRYITGNRQNYVFKNGISYYVRSPTELYGTTRLEAGSVVKFEWAWQFTNASLVVKGDLVCDGRPYLPIWLTSVDDSTVGYEMANPEDPWPQPYPGTAPYLNLDRATSVTLNGLRVCYADKGITTPFGAHEAQFWNCQFYDCNSAIVNQASTPGARDVLHNVLFARCDAAIEGSTNSFEIEGEHVTSGATNFWVAPAPPYKVALTNSIVLGSLGASTVSFMQNTALNPSPTNFQAAFGGHYYLAPGSSLRGAGTPSVTPALLQSFARKTTSAPISFPAYIEWHGDLTLMPQAPRYSGGAPDVGFYYDILDYCILEMQLYGSLKILPGTAVGFPYVYTGGDYEATFGGILAFEGSTIDSPGTPEKPIVFTDPQMVQETPRWPLLASFVPFFMPNDNGLEPPILNFRFCEFHLGYNAFRSTPAYHIWSGVAANADEWSPDSAMTLNVRDCVFHGGGITIGRADFYYYPYTLYYGPGDVKFLNNLFDRVNIAMVPNWDCMNVDLAVEARNNLFREGHFTFEPVPASAGWWTFKENLFDKVTFEQFTPELPITHDYNAYVPITMWWGQYETNFPFINNSDGSTDGVHDVVLSAAPTYQIGPFGDYYLLTNSPLFGAGSRTAGEADLYHYTTRPDQLKEGAEPTNHMVNIGLHYVATEGPDSSAPLDSDGDHIPDFVENRSGDGQRHPGVETDWLNAFTDAGIYDPTNSVYDDRDVDGDALTGVLERFLGCDSLKSDNPLAISVQSPTGGELDAALGLGDAIATNGQLKIMVDGTESPDGEVIKASDGLWRVQLDTCSLSNGWHTLAIVLSYGDSLDMWQTVSGPPCLFVVTNAVTVDGLSTFFTDSLQIDAQVNVPADNFEIDVKDMDGTVVNTLAGVVKNGRIDASWDGLDTNGVPALNGSAVCDFYLAPASAVARSKPKAATLRYKLCKHISGKAFTLAVNENRFPNTAETLTYAVDNLRPGDGTNPKDYDLLPNGYNDPYSDNAFVWFGGTNSNRGTLTNALADSASANLYVFCHGSQNTIGPETNSTGVISALDVRNLLMNWGQDRRTTNQFWNWHPYRLVILDACSTWSKQWSAVWGIPLFQTNSVADYQHWGLDPCAFVGWKAITTNQISADAGTAYGECLSELFSRWYAGQTLLSCFRGYTEAVTNSDNKPYFINFEKWAIAGCTNLTTFQR